MKLHLPLTINHYLKKPGFLTWDNTHIIAECTCHLEDEAVNDELSRLCDVVHHQTGLGGKISARHCVAECVLRTGREADSAG